MVFPRSEIVTSEQTTNQTGLKTAKLRQTYGVWGQSRFSSLEQVVRVKYNTMNNRIALEDSMTKQFITIDKVAIEHITDPDEQAERLGIIMDEVVKLFEGLRGDQMPILPSYVTYTMLTSTTPFPIIAASLIW
jgi:hypothetical protein